MDREAPNGQNIQEPGTHQINPPRSDIQPVTMEQMNLVVSRSMNTPASLYLANEISPEAVIPELNMFRPTTTALPLWNGTSGSAAPAQGMNYSIISSPGTSGNSTVNSNHIGTEAATHNGSKTGDSSTCNSYDLFSENGREESNSSSFPLSPRLSFSESGNQSARESPSNSDQEEMTPSAPKRKKRTPVPDERKDDKYWARRKKNNDAAKRSRDMRRKKVDDELKNAREAIQENQKLKQEIDVLKAEINSLRRLLKDANTTLSLWIRARQAAEPNVQLPPMLRGSNVSFVNFPVSTAS